MKNLSVLLFLFFACSLAGLAQSQATTASSLIHVVFFKPKSEMAKQQLIKSLKTFQTIEVVKKLQIGEKAPTNNPQGPLAEYTVILQLTFENRASFKIYETHAVHLASIRDTQDLLLSPPIGYDYYVRQ